MIETFNKTTPSETYPTFGEDFYRKSIFSTKQFDIWSLLKLFDTTQQVEEIYNKSRDSLLSVLDGSNIGMLSKNLSYEALTLVSSTAVLRLGGKTASYTDTSLAEHESIEDAMLMLQQYCDLIISTHPEKKLYKANANECPVINASGGEKGSLIRRLSELYIIQHEKTSLGEESKKKLLEETDLYINMALLTLVLGKKLPAV